LANIILPSRSSTVLNFTWDTIGYTKGNYILSAYAEPVPGETYTQDNTRIDGIVTIVILRGGGPGRNALLR
jgi:hypothetical protein